MDVKSPSGDVITNAYTFDAVEPTLTYNVSLTVLLTFNANSVTLPAGRVDLATFRKKQGAVAYS